MIWFGAACAIIVTALAIAALLTGKRADERRRPF
jgi:hypothetical protein